MYKFALLALAMSQVALAADCFTNEARQGDQPSGKQVADAITKNNQLDFVCSGSWRVGDKQQLQNTFNHGSMLMGVLRSDKNTTLRHCKDAFTDIISQCITGDKYYGGTWSFDGETYNISNSAYPANPLLPNDDGAQTSSSSSSSGATTTLAPTTTTTTSKNSGPITVGPQTSIEQGTFTTKTTSIAGLTANSVTTTSADGRRTLLPIWFIGPGAGIILIPGAGVIPGGIVPPPPGLPTLVIDGNGDAQTTSISLSSQTTTTTDHASSSSSSTTTTTSCSVCSTCGADIDVLPPSVTGILPNDGDPDLAPVDTKLWSSYDASQVITTTTASPPSPTTTTSSPSPPPASTQPASPIDQPTCVDSADGVVQSFHKLAFPDSIATSDGKQDNNVNDLLYRLRQKVCDGSCTVPDGIDSKYVSIWQDNGACEISVGFTDKIELYMFRNNWPNGGASDFQTQWQQCWDSTDNMIKGCINKQPKESWWNGNHENQFYQTGLRPLNDPGAKHSSQNPINNYLIEATDGFTCSNDCCGGMIRNPDWCIANCRGQCPGFKVRRAAAAAAAARALRPRATQAVKQITAGCDLSYVMPDYPSAGDAAKLAGVGKWFDEDKSTNGNHNCDNPVIKKFPNALQGSEYHTEHVFEKHLLKRFFYYLVGGQQAFDEPVTGNPKIVASCSAVQAVFGSKGNGNGKFGQQTAAQQMAEAISCYDTSSANTCPDNNRLGEFFLLRKEINGMKNRIFAGFYQGIGANANSDKLPQCNAGNQSRDKMRAQMKDAALVFQYMRQQEVFDSFKKVNDRMLAILGELDQDALGQNTRPDGLREYIDDSTPASGLTWTRAYTEFMARFLQDAESKMSLWQFNCKGFVDANIDADASLDAQAKAAEKKKVADYSGGDDIYAGRSMLLGSLYDGIRGQPSNLG